MSKYTFEYSRKGIPGGKEASLHASANELEELLGFKIPFYQDDDYPDDEDTTDFAAPVIATDKETGEVIKFQFWNYKNGHYDDIELSRSDVIEFSFNGPVSMCVYLQERINEIRANRLAELSKLLERMDPTLVADVLKGVTEAVSASFAEAVTRTTSLQLTDAVRVNFERKGDRFVVTAVGVFHKPV